MDAALLQEQQPATRILRPLSNNVLPTPTVIEEGKGSRHWHAEKLWQSYNSSSSPPDVFQNIQLAPDGGLGDVKKQKLLYSMQYFYALQVVAFILMNVTYVVSGDFNCAVSGHCAGMAPNATIAIRDQCLSDAISSCGGFTESDADCVGRRAIGCSRAQDAGNAFLLSRWILNNEIAGERLIACLELLYLFGLLVRAVTQAATSFLAQSELLRWVAVYHLFWQTLPQLSCFSLMRLLYYVTPTVIGTQAYYVFMFLIERLKSSDKTSCTALMAPVWYCITRPVCFIIGFDAFLVKLRMASHSITTGDVELNDVVSVMILLYQILGVVNLNWFVRERLFIFTFGAENGNMSNAQKAREFVWNAMLSRQIYNTFPFWQFIIVMLGFDDYDFQVLVLDPDVPAESENGNGCQCDVDKTRRDLFKFDVDNHDIYRVVSSVTDGDCRSSIEKFALKISFGG
eukprot:TRINITY_DN41580_c0_g1_i1.p1 TRINITY_DN41580_c0_g1~~TRINITY_DN41580_c0_g1_i1.p1  ORF type:complete len:456 (+),score=66.00 TRINITY_DN41580_c0_g1_i1:68-1435(+)